MRKNKLLLLLALLLTAATGAWAQSALTAKEITSASQLTSTDDEAYVAACMPSDFLAVDADVAKAWTGAPTDGSAILIYAIDGNKIKIATFVNGSYKVTTGATWSIESFKNQLTNGKFFYSAAPAGYTVSLKDGVKDADKWTISPNPAEEGQTVTLQYNGRLKVKSVTATSDEKPAAPTGKTVDLSTLTAGYEAKDGETLTGTLANNVKVSIADGATVTLKDVNITNLGENCDWAGINCPGNATLVLEGTNEVCAGRDGSGYNNYPGIYIASGKTLTIQGAGTLTAYSNASNPFAAGIGGGYGIACGNIVINSGTITATGGNDAAGIGGGNEASCGNITISGGTVEARGGGGGAGIGGGYYASCGNIEISGGTVSATGGDCAAGIGGGINNGACGTITITSGVTSVTATKGEYAPNSIGSGDNGTAITVTIGGVEGAITTSPYTYEPAAGNPAPTTASIEDYTAGTFGWDGDGSAATNLPTINTFAANDKISILSAKNTNTQFTTSAGGASATFTGTATDDSKFYAVYPYTSGLTLSGDVISGIVIPTSQWNSGWNSEGNYSGWDPKAPIAYATTTGSSLTFHNACAILKVTITGYGTYAIFTISANEPLAGTFSLDTSTGTLTPTSGSTTVSVGNDFDGNCFNTDGGNKTAYIAIAPGTYTNFRLHLYNEDSEDKQITKSVSVTFEAGKIYDLGSYNVDYF